MKKILLTLGSIISVVSPLSTIIACGNTVPDNNGEPDKTITKDDTNADSNEKAFADNVISMGVVTSDSELVHTNKSELNQDAIDKYKIQNMNNETFKLDDEYKYEYTATSTKIKIYIEKKSDKLTSLTMEMPISRNSFEGKISSKNKYREFLAITDTVKDQAFASYKLSALCLPGVKTIGRDAFYNSVLTSLSLPEVTTIGSKAFDKSRLTSLDLPKVKTIEDNAFMSSKLTTLSLPEVVSIGNQAFYESPVTSLTLPKVKLIAGSAFSSSKLTTLSLPEVTFISDNAFESSILTSLTLPKVQSIGLGAFSSSTLSSLSLPEVRTIAREAFWSSELSSLSLPEVTKIEESAFDSIKNDVQTKITLPKAMKSWIQNGNKLGNQVSITYI